MGDRGVCGLMEEGWAAAWIPSGGGCLVTLVSECQEANTHQPEFNV